ncbi:Retrovirus-related Pol polyprotein from transposon 17.6 [Gossypium australe]|uniref:Retrovirus-related Pol polyprotein from transposon 17.6 n=1 Tax=Gossypium australe TaxID=47621 RepID=A0A5B6WFM1_9ROSI|nr:Retrovirus-related Pol polyprotein from transposon 17.6 [Gossypium australe]
MKCMTVIFVNMLQEGLDVFIDDLSVYRDSFQECLDNLEKVLKRCEETNMVLNWEKRHFMVKGLVLGHQIFGKGLEVDKAKIEVIKHLLNPMNVKCVRNFLGHAGFYQRFIEEFAHISKPLNQLLKKDTSSVFDQSCVRAFEVIKKTSICSYNHYPKLVGTFYYYVDYVVGAILRQKWNNLFRAIHYASKTLIFAQSSYTTIKKDMLVVVFSLKKFDRT